MKKKIKRSYRILIALFMVVLIIGIMLTVFTLKTKKENQETEEIPPYEVYERVDAPYEHWLAAAVVSGISTEYPDFSLEEILSEGETSLSNYKESTGIYVVFTAEGEQKCVHSTPIDTERTDAGTSDVMSTVIGYATFDMISVEEVDVSMLTRVEIEDLNTLIEQSELVTVYSR